MTAVSAEPRIATVRTDFDGLLVLLVDDEQDASEGLEIWTRKEHSAERRCAVRLTFGQAAQLAGVLLEMASDRLPRLDWAEALGAGWPEDDPDYVRATTLPGAS